MAKKKKLRQPVSRPDEGSNQQSASSTKDKASNLKAANKQNGSHEENKQANGNTSSAIGLTPSSSTKGTNQSKEGSDKKTIFPNMKSEPGTKSSKAPSGKGIGPLKKQSGAEGSGSSTSQQQKSKTGKDRKPRKDASYGKVEQRLSMRKNKIKDPRLIPRMKEVWYKTIPRIIEYLESRPNKNFVSIPQMAEYLQDKYPEYGRKKKSMFVQYVDKAYSYMEKPRLNDPPPPLSDTDENSNTEKELVEENGHYVWKNVSEHSRDVEGEKGEEEGSAVDSFSSSEDEDPQDLMEYKDTNAINNSLMNMYRNSPKRSSTSEVEEKKRKPSEKPDSAVVKKSKYEDKVLYPSPNVLDRNLASTGVVGPRRTANDKYFIDRKGDKPDSSNKKDNSEIRGGKEAREVTIQRFLGNLPSRTSYGSYVSDKQDPRLKGKTLYRVHCDKEDSEVKAGLSHSGITEDNVGVTSQPPQSPRSSMEAEDSEPVQLNDPRKTNPVQEKSGDSRSMQGQDRPKQDKKQAKDRDTRTPRKKKNASKSRSHDDSDTESGKKEKGLAVQKSSVTFADVGGNEANLTEICKLLVHMRHPEVYQQLGVTPPRGFLLHGPPGCGKTLLANAIAGELDLAFIKLAATEIVSGVSGDSEEKIRELFEKAMQTAPCVVFIDEIDSITPKRETASKDMERRIVAQLLACMDELNANPTCHVLVIGATNRPDSLDPALRRAGRFDREISLGIPDEQSRLRILQVLCRNLRLSAEFDFSYMAHNTPGYVGADLMALTREAAMTAVNRVFQDLQPQTSCNNEPLQENCIQKTDKSLPDTQSGSSSILKQTDSTTSLLNRSIFGSVLAKTSTVANSVIAQTVNQSSSCTAQSGLNTNVIQSSSTIDNSNATNLTENQSAIGDIIDIGAATSANAELSNVSKSEKDSERISADSMHSSSVQDCKINGQNDTESAATEPVTKIDSSIPPQSGSETSEMKDIDKTIMDVNENAEMGVNENGDSSVKDYIESTVTNSDSDAGACKSGNTKITESGQNVSEMEEDEEGVNKCTVENDGDTAAQGDGPKAKIEDRGSSEYLSVLTWLKEHPPLSEEQLANLYITMEDFKEALKYVQPSAKREGFATIPDVTWDDIGALHEVREELQLAILAPVRHPEHFKSLGLTRAQGVLLAGPPGCGKTLLAKAVANESGINFISVKGPELLNMYVGESERAVRTVFQRARNSSPCVIFFDELDALCPRRSGHSEGNSSARVVNQLLTEMDGLEERKQVFIMAATNRPDIIDPAVLRPGRLDKTLYVGLPTASDRLDILNTITKNGTKPSLADDVNLAAIAEDSRCECFTGADLAALVREASISALKEAIFHQGRQSSSGSVVSVKGDNFDTALRKIKPSVTAKDQERYNSMRNKLAIGT